MGLGSWARFIIGIALSIGIVWTTMTGSGLDGLLFPLSVLYLALTVLWVIKKAALGL